MLTDTIIRSAKPGDKPRKLTDGKGLFLLVTPSGGRLWRFKYRYPRSGPAKKEKLLALGSYPETSLKQARDRCEEARRLLADDVDPGEQRKRAVATVEIPLAAVRTFKATALDWWTARNEAERWHQGYALQVKRQLERDVFAVRLTRGLNLRERDAHPLLKMPVGEWPFDSLTPPDVLEICRNVEARGALDSARDLYTRLGMIFKREKVLGRCSHNPAEDVVALLAKPQRTNHAAITYSELPEFFARLDREMLDPTTSLGLEALLATWLRSTELRLARWRWLDWGARELRIPSGQMKNGERGVGDHVVPLSDYGLHIFRQLHATTGHCELMFPSLLHPGQSISDGAWLNALYRMGYRNKATVHGIRALGSTTANEAYVRVPEVPAPVKMWEVRWIDRQLDHVDDTVSGCYNRAEYMEPRRALMQWWGQKVQEARAVARTLPPPPPPPRKSKSTRLPPSRQHTSVGPLQLSVTLPSSPACARAQAGDGMKAAPYRGGSYEARAGEGG